MSAEVAVWKQGAEARLYRSEFYGKQIVIKERFPKGYRHPVLDKTLTTQRTKSEVKTMMRCRLNGIKTPALYFVDMDKHRIFMEYVQHSRTVKDHINEALLPHNVNTRSTLLDNLAQEVGRLLATIHRVGIIHGDLTTSNILIKEPYDAPVPDLVLIDFGLGYVADISVEDKGVDLYVLERALLSSHPNTEALFTTLLDSYKENYNSKELKEVVAKFEDVRARGRKRTMVG